MSDEQHCQLHEARIALCLALWHALYVAIFFAFLLGVGNFAWHRAVIESGHAMVTEMPPAHLQALRYGTLTFEFVLLCGALATAWMGASHWVWLYGAYSFINGGAAWLIVTRRV